MRVVVVRVYKFQFIYIDIFVVKTTTTSLVRVG